MCVQGQTTSHTQRFLMSVYGRGWRKVKLALFTVYVDDSGTSPDQKQAIAAALVVPALQIPRLVSAWDTFKAKREFNYLHAAEAAAKKGQYKDWDDAKVEIVFNRARQITKNFGTAAFAFQVDKELFDKEAPPEWTSTGGENHYTWAFRNLLNQMIPWAESRQIPPFEFVFDNAVGKDRDEIEMLMAQFEAQHPRCFAGRYSFGCKGRVPALQCVDMIAWSCFAMSRSWRQNAPYSNLAKTTIEDFAAYQDKKWLRYWVYDADSLRDSIKEDVNDVDGVERRKNWHTKYLSEQKINKTKRPKREICPC